MSIYKPQYLSSFEYTRGHEGNYSNHPFDGGGETVWGISRVNHPSADIWALVDQLRPLKGFPAILESPQYAPKVKELALKFYKQMFWDVMKLDTICELSSAVARELFDSGVNVNHVVAVTWFQDVLNFLNRGYKDPPLYANINVDGVVGFKQTIPAFTAYMSKDGDEKVLLTYMNCEQGHYYLEISKSRALRGDERFEAFARGWSKRVSLT